MSNNFRKRVEVVDNHCIQLKVHQMLRMCAQLTIQRSFVHLLPQWWLWKANSFYSSRRGSRILVRGPEELWPQGGLWAQTLLKKGFFPLKLPENCMILKKSWGQGGPGPPAPPGSATKFSFVPVILGNLALNWRFVMYHGGHSTGTVVDFSQAKLWPQRCPHPRLKLQKLKRACSEARRIIHRAPFTQDA